MKPAIITCIAVFMFGIISHTQILLSPAELESTLWGRDVVRNDELVWQYNIGEQEQFLVWDSVKAQVDSLIDSALSSHKNLIIADETITAYSSQELVIQNISIEE